MSPELVDVIIVGSGNAGFSAAASAQEHGAKSIVLLEKAPKSWAGGNTTFTAGAYRTVFPGLREVLPLVNNVPGDLIDKIDMQPYSRDDFMDDLNRMCEGNSDADLAKTLIEESWETTKWLHRNGVQFQLSFNRQAYEIDGRFKFWGGMVLKVEDGGKGLTKMHQQNCEKLGVDVRYDSGVIKILKDDNDEVIGVTVKQTDGKVYDIHARGGVVLCAGGFEANAEMRKEHLGKNWDLAYVRGTPHNTGDVLRLAIDDLGAMPTGDWQGCHSTCWDFDAPPKAGNQQLTNQYTKSGYPLGLMFNADGLRFVDEGEDMRNFTYAKFGRAILQQPEGIAFQIWDAEGAKWLRKEEYAEDVTKLLRADSIEDLSGSLEEGGLKDRQAFLDSINEYNAAIENFQDEHPNQLWDPSKKDGQSTISSSGKLSLGPDKTNWARPIIKPPFVAVKVTCGCTFTFGGLKADAATAKVVHRDGQTIRGLFVAGEMLGGLFYGNYPGGSGLTSGAVFGRKAGREAAIKAVTDDRHRRDR